MSMLDEATDENFLMRLEHLRLDKRQGYDLAVAMLIAMHFHGSIKAMADYYKGKAYVRIGERLIKGTDQ